jgi:uncharacterized protein (DUF1810 family)
MSGTSDLVRFVEAQSGRYEVALDEVRQGAKRSHWMWFIFPQVQGLGHSAMAQHYAIADLDEARAYLAHPLLGARLREITSILQQLGRGTDARQIFGETDAMKLRSSLTLFARADDDPQGLFRAALDRWFGGEEDAATLERLIA